MNMKQILVVGSDPKVSQDLDDYLDPKEFKLLVSPHGKNLLASLANAKPDLVILDLNPADNSGNDIVKKIRNMNSNLPLIVLSKNAIHQEREKNLTLMSYPVQMELVASMIKKTLSSASVPERRRVHLDSVKPLGQKIRPIDKDSSEKKSPEDHRSENQDYQHIFEQVLSPMFNRIITDSKGHIYDRLLSSLEKTIISEVLKFVNHNQVRASQLLGISRNTLIERMKRFDIF
jgi:DNA-binding NtrC family response regulator